MAQELQGGPPPWQPDPPPRPGPNVQLLVTPYGGRNPLRVTLLADAWEGCIVHWTGSRTVPCYGVTGNCVGCRMGHPRTWNGYIPVLQAGARSPGVWVLTWTCVLELRRIREQQGTLYAARLAATRVTDKPNGKVLLTWVGRDRPDQLPERGLDWVRDTLQRVWATAAGELVLDRDS